MIFNLTKFILIIFTYFIINVNGDEEITTIHTPFQVSLRLVGNLTKSGSMHICNGIIINEEYILTTAGCLLEYDFPPNDKMRIPLHNFRIFIGDYSPIIERNVTESFVHEQFNVNDQMNNDIAILKLSEPLTLSNDSGVNKIETLDELIDYENCFVTYFDPMKTDLGYPYISPTSVNIANMTYCERPSYTTRNSDICLQYKRHFKHTCIFYMPVLRWSNDRSAGLVCNNKLVGIISHILEPNKNEHSCYSFRKTAVYYEDLFKHKEWIANVINRKPEIDVDENVTDASSGGDDETTTTLVNDSF